MSTVPQYPLSFLADTSCEHLELQDVGRCGAGFADDGPLGSVVLVSDLDAMQVEAERHVPVPDGFTPTLCQACNALVFIAAHEPREVLCFSCNDLGEVLAVLGDDDPRPPTGGALTPEEPAYWQAVAAN